MIVNFNDEEAIITFDGLQIVIQKEKAWSLANQIFEYFSDIEDDV